LIDLDTYDFLLVIHSNRKTIFTVSKISKILADITNISEPIFIYTLTEGLSELCKALGLKKLGSWGYDREKV